MSLNQELAFGKRRACLLRACKMGTCLLDTWIHTCSYGKIKDVTIKSGFAFIEFDRTEDAVRLGISRVVFVNVMS